MLASKRLDDLHHTFRPVAKAILDTATNAGLDPVIVMTVRDAEKQLALWKIGRELLPDGSGWRRIAGARVVTWAAPGQSPHEFRLAIDCCPRALLTEKDWAPDSPLWVRYGEIVRACGAVWGGDFKAGKVDRPHVQAKDWRMLAFPG